MRNRDLILIRLDLGGLQSGQFWAKTISLKRLFIVLII